MSSTAPTLPLLQQYIGSISNKGVTFDARPVYLDSQATTRIDPRVIDVMNQYHVEQWGNPHSSTHLYGWETDDAVEEARKQVDALSIPRVILQKFQASPSLNALISALFMLCVCA